MNILDKVQVFNEIVFNKEKVPSFYRFCCAKVGHFALFAFLRGIFQCLWKTASLKTKFNLEKREKWYGNSSISIKLFCFKKAYFCNFTKILVVVSTQPTCPYCTSYNALWYRWLGGREVSAVDRSAPCTLGFRYACGFDTPMWYFFSWFSFSFIICTSFWNAFCFNIIIQTF